jgi:lipopolysaccharide export system permease protein
VGNAVSLVHYPAFFPVMSLFKRAVISEVASNASVVFSTLIVVWLSIVLVRLLGEAARGVIGADVVIGLAALTTIAALPTIMALSVFIGVLTTVSRSYRESEMVVWFASGVSLLQWTKPVLQIAVPVAIVVGGLTLFASPWSHQQIEDYRARFDLRSDISQVTSGDFIELDAGRRIIFAEPSADDPDELGQVFVRILDAPWHSVVSAKSARVEVAPNGDRFLVLTDGTRYDFRLGMAQARLSDFEAFGARLETKNADETLTQARERALSNRKARPTALLLQDSAANSDGQLMWRLAIPLATINLALLAIPLGAANPRVGRSFDLLIAGLVALLYMNLINASHGWINKSVLSFEWGVWLVHGLFAVLTALLLWLRLRVRAPKDAQAPAPDVTPRPMMQ